MQMQVITILEELETMCIQDLDFNKMQMFV